MSFRSNGTRNSNAGPKDLMSYRFTVDLIGQY
jgi:hypothetical protein